MMFGKQNTIETVQYIFSRLKVSFSVREYAKLMMKLIDDDCGNRSHENIEKQQLLQKRPEIEKKLFGSLYSFVK